MRTTCIFLFLLITVPVLYGAATPNAATLKKQHAKLSAIDRSLVDYHAKLSEIKNELVAIKLKAEDTNITNAIKIFIKGSLDIAGRVSAPAGLSGAYGLLTDAWNNLVAEPYLWSGSVEARPVPVDALKSDIAALRSNNRKLYQYCNELIVIMKSPLPRFEDDSEPFPATADFWRDPDGRPDDEIELTTRKLTVIRGFTGVIIRMIDAELASSRAKRSTVSAELGSLSAAIASAETGEQAKKSSESRQVRRIENIDDRADDGKGSFSITGEDQLGEAEIREQQRLKEERERARKSVEERIRRLEASSRIIIDKDSPTRLMTGEPGYYLAVVDPPLESMADIEWFIDDRKVTTTFKDNTSVLSTSFPAPGTYVVRAVLKIRGKEHDQHLINIRVSSPEKPPRYPPEMEGKTTPALNLDWCKYETLYKGGKIYITGYYYTPARQKVSYTSLPVENFSPHAPAAGMILTKTAGYHIYQTDPDGDATVYIITRMRGAEVKIIHRLAVRRFSMDVAKDYSRITVRYQTEATMNTDRWETIVLD